jgi:hypothetical protein
MASKTVSKLRSRLRRLIMALLPIIAGRMILVGGADGEQNASRVHEGDQVVAGR